MPPLVIHSLAGGLNLHDPATEIAHGQMAGGANLLFARGLAKTPFGFARSGSASLPLDSGNPVMALYTYAEQGPWPTDHIIAATTGKVYERNIGNDTWVDISPAAALASDLDSVFSFVAVPHTDALAADGTGLDCNYHLLLCDGGKSPVYRWAGKFETRFYVLAGADGYHEADLSPATPTAHYCRQVNVFYNHVILLSPKTWDAAANEFIENPQLVLYGKAGLLEGSNAYKTGDAGTGGIDLADTGDENVWCALLGNVLMVYQKHSIWYIYHVGGADVFLAKPQITDMGLLAPGLFLPWQNRHYFVDDDYNLQEYLGGTAFRQIGGDLIRDALKDDMDPTRTGRCRMCMGANGSRLWLFIVRNGETHITRAYGVDTRTGAWMIRDYAHKWASGGITAVALLGAQSVVTGRTYQEDIDDAETYATAICAGTSYNQLVNRSFSGETMAMGDGSGNVYQYDESLLADDGVAIPCSGRSKVFDLGRPDGEKWWNSVQVTARGTVLSLSYRIGDFETEDDGWVHFPHVTLTNEFATCEFDLQDVTSEAIQFQITNHHTVIAGDVTTRTLVATDWFEVKKLVLAEPQFIE